MITFAACEIAYCTATIRFTRYLFSALVHTLFFGQLGTYAVTWNKRQNHRVERKICPTRGEREMRKSRQRNQSDMYRSFRIDPLWSCRNELREQRVKFKLIHMRVKVYGARANYAVIPQRGFNNDWNEREEGQRFRCIRINHIVPLSSVYVLFLSPILSPSLRLIRLNSLLFSPSVLPFLIASDILRSSVRRKFQRWRFSNEIRRTKNAGATADKRKSPWVHL